MRLTATSFTWKIKLTERNSFPCYNHIYDDDENRRPAGRRTKQTDRRRDGETDGELTWFVLHWVFIFYSDPESCRPTLTSCDSYGWRCWWWSYNVQSSHQTEDTLQPPLFRLTVKHLACVKIQTLTDHVIDFMPINVDLPENEEIISQKVKLTAGCCSVW